MFGSINPTRYDLRFSLFGIPIYVHPSFWLVAALMGWQPGRIDLVVTWILCVFVSIVVHELGHGLLQLRWGSGNYIQLYYSGGVAVYIPDAGYTPKRSILVSLAGPAAGFLLAGFVWLLNYGFMYYLRHHATPEFVADFINSRWAQYYGFAHMQLMWINIWWGVLNLLPLLPLDGGHVSMEVCQLSSRYRGQEYAYRIAIITAIIVVVWLNREGQGGYMYPSILLAYLGFQNWQALNRLTGRNW